MKKILILSVFTLGISCRNKVETGRDDKVSNFSKKEPVVLTWKSKFPSLWNSAYGDVLPEPTPETVTYQQFLNAVAGKVKSDMELLPVFENIGRTEPSQVFEQSPGVFWHNLCTMKTQAGGYSFSDGCLITSIEKRIKLDKVESCKYQIVQTDILPSATQTNLTSIFYVDEIRKNLIAGTGKVSFSLYSSLPKIRELASGGAQELNPNDPLKGILKPLDQVKLIITLQQGSGGHSNSVGLSSIEYEFYNKTNSSPAPSKWLDIFPKISFKNKYKYEINYSCK